MESTRLTDPLRNRIARRLMQGKWNERVEALVIAYAALADMVYNEKYAPSVRNRMGELPRGWLPEDYDITVKFSEASGDYVNLDFNGEDGYLREVLGIEYKDTRKFEKEHRRYLHQDVGKPVLVERATTIKAWRHLQAERRAIEKEHEKLREEVMKVLYSVTTTGALVKRWPEVAPVLAELAPVPVVALPAPILKDLNKQLGLKAVANVP